MIDGAKPHADAHEDIHFSRAARGIIAAMIFAFTISWAAFVYPMAFLYSADQQVLTVGTVTSSLIRGGVYKWGMLAGSWSRAAGDLRISWTTTSPGLAGSTKG